MEYSMLKNEMKLDTNKQKLERLEELKDIKKRVEKRAKENPDLMMFKDDIKEIDSQIEALIKETK